MNFIFEVGIITPPFPPFLHMLYAFFSHYQRLDVAC